MHITQSSTHAISILAQTPAAAPWSVGIAEPCLSVPTARFSVGSSGSSMAAGALKDAELNSEVGVRDWLISGPWVVSGLAFVKVSTKQVRD